MSQVEPRIPFITQAVPPLDSELYVNDTFMLHSRCRLQCAMNLGSYAAENVPVGTCFLH